MICSDTGDTAFASRAFRAKDVTSDPAFPNRRPHPSGCVRGGVPGVGHGNRADGGGAALLPVRRGGGGLLEEEQAAYNIAVGRLAGLQHPALRAVVCGGCDPVDGIPFIATEWIEGTAAGADRPAAPLACGRRRPAAHAGAGSLRTAFPRARRRGGVGGNRSQHHRARR